MKHSFIEKIYIGSLLLCGSTLHYRCAASVNSTSYMTLATDAVYAHKNILKNVGQQALIGGLFSFSCMRLYAEMRKQTAQNIEESVKMEDAAVTNNNEFMNIWNPKPTTTTKSLPQKFGLLEPYYKRAESSDEETKSKEADRAVYDVVNYATPPLFNSLQNTLPLLLPQAQRYLENLLKTSNPRLMLYDSQFLSFRHLSPTSAAGIGIIACAVAGALIVQKAYVSNYDWRYYAEDPANKDRDRTGTEVKEKKSAHWLMVRSGLARSGATFCHELYKASPTKAQWLLLAKTFGLGATGALLATPFNIWLNVLQPGWLGQIAGMIGIPVLTVAAQVGYQQLYAANPTDAVTSLVTSCRSKAQALLEKNYKNYSVDLALVGLTGIAGATYGAYRYGALRRWGIGAPL